ncbi:Ribosomal lysine N-methyltransferase 4 [Madurella mycetomatis]|uniref:Ribosomal lysine N-methyltransferase 4 n=1 Tax=Madurella mycetomatis TaxID=100816 RepID=A0A175VX69_9PEZI|nr:Ribosomal lysine N-methyltransferase 4 [Madurella mycetomatis]KXX76138.1 Ribosomal lysine N-methyltransferase 4 [Madurella mycetomatis]
MELDSGTDPSFLEGSQKFVNWFRVLPGATFHRDITIEDLRERNAGRGIVAKADIEADTILFTIPRDAIICMATSALKTQIPDVFNLEDDDAERSEDEDPSLASQDSWTLLILVMIHEYLQGNASRWKPYLDVLPSAFDTPMFWSEAELSELQASSLVTKIGRDEADRMIKSKILPIVRANEHVFFPSSSPKLDDTQLLALAHRMGSTIMAYAFDLDKDEENNEADEDDGWVEDRDGKTMLGMVPMADMLNADAEFNAHINHGQDVLTATALRTIRAGEEILNYYGPLSSGELLRRYGYVTPKHSRYDVVELPWALVEKQLREWAGVGMTSSDWEKVKEVIESDEDFEESFVLERSSEDPDSTGRLAGQASFDGMPDELGEQFKTLLKAGKKVKSVGLVAQVMSDRDIRKELFLQSVLGALQDREAQYHTSLEDDERLLSAGQVTGRRALAVWIRRGEKQLLREAQEWTRQELIELRNKASERISDNEIPAAKRRRI